MIAYALSTAILAAVSSATAFKGNGASLIDSNYNTFVETELFVQFNSQGLWLNTIHDATWKFTNSTALSTEETDLVSCFFLLTYAKAPAPGAIPAYTCFHFLSTSHAGEDAALSLQVN